MKRRFYILLLFILGFVLMPSMTFACGSKSEKSFSKKNSCKKADNSCCCKKDKEHSNSKEGCGGNLGGKSCHCPPVVLSFALLPSKEGHANIFDFFDKNQKFNYSETYLSSGFYSIWIPPIIG